MEEVEPISVLNPILQGSFSNSAFAMEEVDLLHQQWTECVASLLAEHYGQTIYGDTETARRNTPNFVFDIFSLFFQTSDELIADISEMLEKKIVDFEPVVSNLHKLRGSSQSVGALKMRNTCIAFRHYCAAKDVGRCKECLLLLENERGVVKKMMEPLFELEAKIVAAGGTVPAILLLKNKNKAPDMIIIS